MRRMEKEFEQNVSSKDTDLIDVNTIKNLYNNHIRDWIDLKSYLMKSRLAQEINDIYSNI